MAKFATFTLLGGQPIFVRVESVVAVSPVKGAPRTNIFISTPAEANSVTVQEEASFVLLSLGAIEQGDPPAST